MHIAIAFVNIGPYHLARLRATAELCRDAGWRLSAVEVTDDQLDHPWGTVETPRAFAIETLLPAHGVRGARWREAHSRAASRSLKARFDLIRPDAVLIPGWSHPAARGALRWCLAHGALPIMMSESKKDDAPRSWWREAYKGSVIRAHSAALVGGRAHRDYLVELGMDPAAIFFGYDAVDNEYFVHASDNIRRNSGATRQALSLPESYFVASSVFVKKKNLFRLLEAYALYRRRASGATWDLVLLGEGELRAQVEETVRRLRLSGCVHLPGFVPYDQLPAYLSLASAFVHASTVEQWGLVVNEAMASALPVLVSDRCGCAAELVEHGSNGFLFDPFDVSALADRLDYIATLDSTHIRAMGRLGRQRIAAWGPARFAEGVHNAVSFSVNTRGDRQRRLWSSLA
jgi:glycosyltransferase involved in cell wall biosynthesis